MEEHDSTRQVRRSEFIALIAMMLAIVALSVDAMLPAMPSIAADLQLSDPQRASLILTSFLVGLGIATFFTGPISDAFGRRPVVFVGLLIYAIGALWAWYAQSLESMLAARVLQGIGAAGPRVVSAAIVRDRYSGAQMASIMSFALMLFLIIPALAPMLGAWITMVSNWRMIFATFVLFSILLITWFGMRQPETLPVEQRRPIKLRSLLDALSQIFSHPTTRLSICVQTLSMTVLFSVLTMVQPIFDITFGRADNFPYWFGAIAFLSGVSSFLNARIVERLGMRCLVTWALRSQIVISSATLILLLMNVPGAFWIYLVWQLGVMLQVGFTTANLNSMAMEPMGHIAGTASSVIAGTTMIGGAALASILAPLFDGTPVPITCISLTCVCLSLVIMAAMRRAEGALV